MGMMRKSFGTYTEYPFMSVEPENVPKTFETLFNSMLEGIKSKGGKMDLETLRIIIHQPNSQNMFGTLAVRVDADFKEHPMFEEAQKDDSH